MLGRVLQEEVLALPPVGIALHRERAVLEVRHEHGRDGAVVRDEIALRDPLLGPEDLVEVRKLEHPLALTDLVLERLLAPDLGRALVLAEPLVRGRSQMPVVRPLAEADLAHELRLDPDDVALSHLRHLRDLSEWRLRALERPELREQPLDLGIGEARAAIPDKGELAAAIDGENQRAERVRAAALAPRVTGDHELLPALGLHLEPVARPTAREIAGICALRDDPFEVLLLGGLEQGRAVVEGLRELDGSVRAVE